MSYDQDDIRIAEAEYGNALDVIRKCHPGKQGFGDEAKYGEAYQRLVIMGARPQIKLKYRRN